MLDFLPGEVSSMSWPAELGMQFRRQTQFAAFRTEIGALNKH